jgi:uncharacterized protein (DUF169 family)/NAD-dependent dihydropyrimidine dehydrogenase PreA subunit
MPFTIDQNLCVGCGSCIGNCPNRAIVRRGAGVVITDMCCDCGTCARVCGVSAIARGAARADFDAAKIDAALKEKLAVTREIVAMKFADKAPEGVSPEDGLNFWCHICGDIFEEGAGPVFFTAQNSVCGGGAALGLGARSVDPENVKAVMEVMTGQGGYFETSDLFTKARLSYPRFPRLQGGIVLGPLTKVPAPDMILLPVNGRQMCMIATAYGFETGELIQGSAGGGTCLETAVIPFLENRPVFTCGDHGGRMHMRLRDDDFLACLPWRLVPGIVKNLDKTVFTTE